MIHLNLITPKVFSYIFWNSIQCVSSRHAKNSAEPEDLVFLASILTYYMSKLLPWFHLVTFEIPPISIQGEIRPLSVAILYYINLQFSVTKMAPLGETHYIYSASNLIRPDLVLR